MSTIWIVDDDEEMATAVGLMLRLIQCDSRIFPDARTTAQALLEGPQPDLMLLDINMPGVTGLDLLEFIRRRGQWQRMPVLMLSTEAADTTVDKALKLGADGYVTKPVTIEELEQAVGSALQNRKKGIS